MSNAPAPGNLPELTVSELSQRLRRTVEDTFGLVRVRGEISGFKRAASGHMYLTLKDADANLDAVLWRGSAQKLSFKPEDGLEVVCTGRITTYPARSRYQMVVERMEPAGVGALMALLEQRKKKLAAEGLFDAERKRPLPHIPNVIGIVTSPTGAVIRDILHRLRDRFPRRVLLWPVLVQGEGAAEQVAAAIRGFNALPEGGPIPRPDLLIVARGGGSIEDLWAFNEESVVRAAAASAIPLISAVGHETDTTLIDFASDRRAPTPTAAAEMAVPVRAELVVEVMDLHRRLVECTQRVLDIRRERVAALGRGLGDPRRLIQAAAQRIDDAAEHLRRALLVLLKERRLHLAETAAPGRIERALAALTRQKSERLAGLGQRLRAEPMRLEIVRGRRDLGRCFDALRIAARRVVTERNQQLVACAKLLESLSYRSVLARGFALARTAEGAALASAGSARTAGHFVVEFADGGVGVQVEETATRRTGRAPPKPEQGKLL
ncbi:exodeoxyribonuclease VII large subunit [Desertibaculum subflavum]|uniref:exodeoxyribonuclease VII large subunit n=1 Tax=Desertibaculum subflavum TaxID=2268458 RepID=UPI000E674FCE